MNEMRNQYENKPIAKIYKNWVNHSKEHCLEKIVIMKKKLMNKIKMFFEMQIFINI